MVDLTRAQILALSGRELDAELAIRLWGWRWFRNRKRGLLALYPPAQPPYVRWNFSPDWWEEMPDGSGERFTDWDRCGSVDENPTHVLPRYSSTWEGLGLVVGEMERHGWRLACLQDVEVCESRGPGRWRAQFGRIDPAQPGGFRLGGSVWAEEAPVATARAALLAVGEARDG